MSAQQQSTISLDVWTDVRLDRARQHLATSHPDVQLQLHYHPFMIDPGTAAEGEDYMAYNRRRWGGDGWTRSMREMGRAEGAHYSNWKVWPNTTHASRVLLLAERAGKSDALMGELYQMCYDEGENVSLRETVARAATRAGVPGGAEYAHSDEGMDELRLALTNARVNGKRVKA
eukprot:6496340-Prymnesium_polylepis.1